MSCPPAHRNNSVVSYSAIAANCNCQRNSCNSTCSDMCLECPALAAGITYYIPVAPTLAATTADASGDNNQVGARECVGAGPRRWELCIDGG